MTVHIYRLNDDRNGWNRVATVEEDGSVTALTDFAEDELVPEIERHSLPDEEDMLVRKYNGPYIRAERDD